MQNAATLADQLAKSTIRVECQYGDGKTGTGTAFFFTLSLGETCEAQLLVTNKHVVEGSTTGALRFRSRQLKNGIPAPCIVQIQDFEAAWLFHPDPDVDLCVMPLGVLAGDLNRVGVDISFVGEQIIPTPADLAEMGSIEDVIMIGYPNGIWDSHNNQAIIRRGITATHPELDYEGRSEFMIDAACFPGSSGSPVFLFSPVWTSTRSRGTTLGEGRVRLLGVLYAGPVQETTGEIHMITVPTRQHPIAISRIPMNLGLVVKAHRLLDFRTKFAGAGVASAPNNGLQGTSGGP